MRFKIDENLPVEVAGLFIRAGYECSTVSEEKLNGHPDSEVRKACDTEQRVLVTLDWDFSDTRFFVPSEHSGCIVLSPDSQGKRSILELTEKLLPFLTAETPEHRLWILTERNLRIKGG